MGATHFLTKALPKVAAEMALSVLAYNLTRVMNIIGVRSLLRSLSETPPGSGYRATSQGRFDTTKTRSGRRQVELF